MNKKTLVLSALALGLLARPFAAQAQVQPPDDPADFRHSGQSADRPGQNHDLKNIPADTVWNIFLFSIFRLIVLL